MSEITTLNQLNNALDRLLADIEQDCQECQDPDCMGYIWLMRSEAEHLYQIGVSLVEVNGGPTFIHSFPAVDGQIQLSVRYPVCSQLCTTTRRCTIHHQRPFVCHLYPIGLETTADGKRVWALHLDCLYVKRMRERERLDSFFQRARQLIRNLSPSLTNEIVSTYLAVDALVYYPNGENNYIPLEDIHHVQV